MVQLDSDKEPRPLAASDTLAPFTTLRNDEERQKKAEYRRPGTYFVVAIPLSFVDLEEYRNTSNDPPERSPVVLGDSTQVRLLYIVNKTKRSAGKIALKG